MFQLRPEEHAALGQAVRNRGVAGSIIRHADGVEDNEADVPLNDDDAVDLLTQAQGVSGRSDQEEAFNPALNEDRAAEQPVNDHDDIAVPESAEPYVDLMQDDFEGSIAEEQTEQSLSDEQPNGTLEATQTLGLADLEAFMEGEEEEELIESEEEMEEEEPIQDLENGHVTEASPNGMDSNNNDDHLATTSTNAELGDIPDTADPEEETVGSMETQGNWNIRKGQDGAVRAAQIIRGPTQKR